LPSRIRPNKVSVIETYDGKNYVGINQGGTYSDPVQKALDSLGNSNAYDRQCAEIDAISQAVNDGADLFGAKISTAEIRGLGSNTGKHGTAANPCNVCGPLIKHYGIDIIT